MEGNYPRGYLDALERRYADARARNSRPQGAIVEAPPAVRPQGQSDQAWLSYGIFTNYTEDDLSWLTA